MCVAKSLSTIDIYVTEISLKVNRYIQLRQAFMQGMGCLPFQIHISCRSFSDNKCGCEMRDFLVSFYWWQWVHFINSFRVLSCLFKISATEVEITYAHLRFHSTLVNGKSGMNTKIPTPIQIRGYENIGMTSIYSCSHTENRQTQFVFFRFHVPRNWKYQSLVTREHATLPPRFHSYIWITLEHELPKSGTRRKLQSIILLSDCHEFVNQRLKALQELYC